MSGAAALQGRGFGAFRQAAWSVPWSADHSRSQAASTFGGGDE